MIALGLMIVLQAIVTVGFGVTPKSIPSFAPHAVEVLGLRLGSDRLIAVAVSIALILLLYFFLKRTKLGLALTAAAQHREASLLMGINPTHMSLTAMAVGSAMASVAGGLMGSIFPLNPVMGGDRPHEGAYHHHPRRHGQSSPASWWGDSSSVLSTASHPSYQDRPRQP